jgi:hypothetical protein
MANEKTESDLLFEVYLASQRLPFQYEKQFDFSRNLIDYVLEFEGQEFLFEVKQFDPGNYPLSGTFAVDPYREIRSKITDAQKQFKGFSDYPCSIVLCNPKGALVELSNHNVMLGAMYGDAGFTMEFDASAGRAVGDPQRAFLDHGKMLRRSERKLQNTRISALVTLRRFHIGSKRLSKRLMQVNFGSKQAIREYSGAISDTPEFQETQVCTIVWENAYAKTPLPESVFRGDFDIRWGRDGEYQRITYAGSGIAEFID